MEAESPEIRVEISVTDVPSVTDAPIEYAVHCYTVIQGMLCSLTQIESRDERTDMAYHLLSFVHTHAYRFLEACPLVKDGLILTCRATIQGDDVPERIRVMCDTVLERLTA